MNKTSYTLSPHLLTFFKKYIELDTSLDSGINYPKTIDLLEIELKRVGFTTEQIKIPVSIAQNSNRIHLITRRFTDNSLPTLLIYNHIDVVPADYPEAFQFQMKNSKVYGRGTSDHKGGTVAVIDMFEKLKNVSLRFNLIFWATTDEETDQIDQLRYMTSILKLPKETLVFDTDTFAGGITVARLGQITWKLIIKGTAAHSAMSNLGKNAVEDAAQFIIFLTKLKQTIESKSSQFKAFPSSGITYVHSQLNVTQIQGGTAINTIPDKCEITIDIRCIPETDVYKKSFELMDKIRKFSSQQKIDFEVISTHITQGYGSETMYAKELSNIYKRITGKSGMYCILGSNQLTEWAKELKLPHFGLGVARGENHIHGINEFVQLQDINEVSQTLLEFLKK